MMMNHRKSKIEKYVIHATRQDGIPWTWWARVPYGTYRGFRTWNEAADFLRIRYALRTDEGRTL